MVVVTINLPEDVNMLVEHFKIDYRLKDKRDAIVAMLRNSATKEKVKSLQEFFAEADKMPCTKITPNQLRKMKEEMYE